MTANSRAPVFIEKPVVVLQHTRQDCQAVLLNDRPEGVAEAMLLPDGVLHFLDRHRMVPEQVRFEQGSEHAIAHVRLSNHIVHIPLLGGLGQVLQDGVLVAKRGTT